MAGVKVAPRSDRHIFSTRAAARNALVYAGASGQVYHIVVEGKRLALFSALKHLFRQLFVLLHYYRLVLFCKRVGVFRVADHRFHTKLCKAQIKHSFYIFKKIGVRVGKCTPHIIIFTAPRLYELLKFRHDFFPAAVSGVIHTQSVVNFLSAVKT